MTNNVLLRMSLRQAKALNEVTTTWLNLADRMSPEIKALIAETEHSARIANMKLSKVIARHDEKEAQRRKS